MVESRKATRHPAIRALLDKITADVWFTSDFHLGHFNIIRYCNRPFADTHEMNAAILEHLNAAAEPNNLLYLLGDSCMGGPKAIASFREQIARKAVHFIDEITTKRTRKSQDLFTGVSSTVMSFSMECNCCSLGRLPEVHGVYE